MLDIKFIRENKDLIALAAKKKHIAFDVNALLATDDKRRALMASIEKHRAEQNEASLRIAKATTAERSAIVESMKFVKESLAKEEERARVPAMAGT